MVHLSWCFQKSFHAFVFVAGENSSTNDKIFLYAIVIPLFILGLILFLIFYSSRYHLRKNDRRQSHHHSHCTENFKSSIKPRQSLIHHNGVTLSSTANHASNDYLTDSMDPIPITRPYQPHQYYPSDCVSLTSPNLYYARIQAPWKLSIAWIAYSDMMITLFFVVSRNIHSLWGLCFCIRILV